MLAGVPKGGGGPASPADGQGLGGQGWMGGRAIFATRAHARAQHGLC